MGHLTATKNLDLNYFLWDGTDWIHIYHVVKDKLPKCRSLGNTRSYAEIVLLVIHLKEAIMSDLWVW